jgi:hypothetical protein
VTDLNTRRGILDPDAAARHFPLGRYAPAAHLAHRIDRHWVVACELEEPCSQANDLRKCRRGLLLLHQPGASGGRLDPRPTAPWVERERSGCRTRHYRDP